MEGVGSGQAGSQDWVKRTVSGNYIDTLLPFCHVVEHDTGLQQ